MRFGHSPFRGTLAALSTLCFIAASAAAQQPDQPAPQNPAPETPPATPEQGAGTHTVRKGDTLWDIARQYLSDPFLWPEIYRLNTAIIEDPHWIYPGESLALPGAGGAQVVAQDELAPEPPPQPVPDSPRPAIGSTVFAGGPRRALTTSRFGGTANEYPHTAVRPGEFYAAPWADRPAGPSGQGHLVASAEMPGISMQTPPVDLLPEERAYITLPKSIVPARGDRFLVFSRGPLLRDGAQVMIPTGVVEVERADNGDASTVRIIAQYGSIQRGQGIVPLPPFALPVEARPAPLTLGTEANVVFVADGAVQPSLGAYIVLDATAKDGVKLGDQFTLFRPRQHVQLLETGQKVVLPEEPIALAQVVKVTDRGITAVVVDQRHPAIKVGTRARLTARMP